VYGASLRQFKSDSKQQGKEGPFKRKKGLKTSWAFFVELSTSESVNVKRKKDTFRVTIVDSRQCDVQIAFYANLFSSLVNRLVNIQV
jgi:hypothetical protein